MSRYFKTIKRRGFVALREKICYYTRAQFFPRQGANFSFNSSLFARFSVVLNVKKK